MTKLEDYGSSRLARKVNNSNKPASKEHGWGAASLLKCYRLSKNIYSINQALSVQYTCTRLMDILHSGDGWAMRGHGHKTGEVQI